jgi:hypothetical protein
MNIKKLTQGLAHCGEAEGKKKTYQVFSCADFYVVMSLSTPAAGNFKIVEADAVEFVGKRFAGKKAVTTADVVKMSRKTQHAPDQLAALNILYVLAATGHAKVDGRRVGQQLFFNFKS